MVHLIKIEIAFNGIWPAPEPECLFLLFRRTVGWNDGNFEFPFGIDMWLKSHANCGLCPIFWASQLSLCSIENGTSSIENGNSIERHQTNFHHIIKISWKQTNFKLFMGITSNSNSTIFSY